MPIAESLVAKGVVDLAFLGVTNSMHKLLK
jgi:hypothetical protein